MQAHKHFKSLKKKKTKWAQVSCLTCLTVWLKPDLLSSLFYILPTQSRTFWTLPAIRFSLFTTTDYWELLTVLRPNLTHHLWCQQARNFTTLITQQRHKCSTVFFHFVHILPMCTLTHLVYFRMILKCFLLISNLNYFSLILQLTTTVTIFFKFTTLTKFIKHKALTLSNLQLPDYNFLCAHCGLRQKLLMSVSNVYC